ncbi:hypothetical protein AVEN_56626-1 [Araneus ventricosus]|uniref:Uncharacterized protein n=1 Tax=Araneus ventricosus TaxID=182803 RepID=A0A4Y2I0W4_ARAVE|nr:hypothetical protein AVEN_56626-1 [Araneus ventricosus]
MNRFLGNLWCQSDVLVVPGLFDDYISQEAKTKIMDALKTEKKDESLKRAEVDLDLFLKKVLRYFKSTNTRRSSKVLNVPSRLLQEDVTE